MNIKDSLKVAILPLDISLADKKANINAAESMLKDLSPDTDIAVLPELFSTAYVPSRESVLELAEEFDGPTMQWAKEMAQKYDAAICGSFFAKEKGEVYNRAFFAEPSGSVHFYDKRHLFSLSGEGEVVYAGEKASPIINFRGWNIALAVCYDLRFPCWLRNKNLSYDLLIIPANWPQKRALAWHTLLQARAIENQAYTVGADRSGTDEYGVYDGLSLICDYIGQPIQTQRGLLSEAVLQKNNLEKFRQKFPFWRDAD